jgi:hypothetical protein
MSVRHLKIFCVDADDQCCTAIEIHAWAPLYRTDDAAGKAAELKGLTAQSSHSELYFAAALDAVRAMNRQSVI